MNLKQKNNLLVLFHFKQAADQGHSKAQYHLAFLYDVGEDVEDNSQLAFKYYKLAADQGNAFAIYELGYFYDPESGTNMDQKAAIKDVAIAFKHFKLAADLGHDDAQYYIGRMYNEGRGTEQNKLLAQHYLQLAINLESVDAAFYWKEQKW